MPGNSGGKPKGVVDSASEFPSLPLLGQTAPGIMGRTWALESNSPNIESGSATYK